MKNKFVIVILFMASLSACKKSYLDISPQNTVTLDQAVQTASDVQAAANGIYVTLGNSNFYGRDAILRGDLMADNVYISSTNSNRNLQFYQLNYLPTDPSVTGFWNAAYACILRANNVINASVTGVNQYKGEALALRALCYFELVRNFATPYTVDPSKPGVPIVLAYDPAVRPARNTVKEVYTQIEADLNQAIGLLGERSPYNASYISKNAAKALLARVYQFEANWTNALSTAQDIINNGGYTLLTVSNFASYWSNASPRTDKIESLFELNFDATNNPSLNSLEYFYAQTGYGDALATNDLYNQYSATDVRKSLIIDATRGGVPVKVVNKYQNNSNTNKSDMKIIRLSEVYLIAAEAAARTNNEPLALTYLNAVATKRDPSFTGYTSSGSQLISDILLERRKELAFEGFRYWDFVRTNTDVVRVNVNNNYPANVPLVFEASNFRRILPIPQAELDANPAIRSQQNPGY